MAVYNGICVYIVPSTGQLALYSIIYYDIVYYRGRNMAVTEAMKEAIWLQGLLDNLRID